MKVVATITVDYDVNDNTDLNKEITILEYDLNSRLSSLYSQFLVTDLEVIEELYE